MNSRKSSKSPTAPRDTKDSNCKPPSQSPMSMTALDLREQDISYFVLGVDQTGRRHGSGYAKLPCFWIYKVSSSEEFEILSNPSSLATHYLPSLKPVDVMATAKHLASPSGPCIKILILADCVLSLPDKISAPQDQAQTLKDLMKRAAGSTARGLSAGEAFFKDIETNYQLGPDDLLTEREKTWGAQSVFRSRPYQRNIQTGTYRIWQDLGSDTQAFNIWPHEAPWQDSQITITEVYPSWARQQLAIPRSGSQPITAKLKLTPDELHQYSRDHQDAIFAVFNYIIHNVPDVRVADRS